MITYRAGEVSILILNLLSLCPVTGFQRCVQPVLCRLDLAYGTVVSSLLSRLHLTSLTCWVRRKPLPNKAQAKLPSRHSKPLFSEPTCPLGGGCCNPGIPELYFLSAYPSPKIGIQMLIRSNTFYLLPIGNQVDFNKYFCSEL